ncbi:MAG: hypothetical protein ACI9W6_002849 [Motiliproteus sp.]|jgi:hypothetical protein
MLPKQMFQQSINISACFISSCFIGSCFIGSYFIRTTNEPQGVIAFSTSRFDKFTIDRVINCGYGPQHQGR